MEGRDPFHYKATSEDLWSVHADSVEARISEGRDGAVDIIEEHRPLILFLWFQRIVPPE